MITMLSSGSFKDTYNFFDRILEISKISKLDEYGKMGVEALQNATPVDTGKTAASWTYDIRREKGRTFIEWHNTNVINGQNIAILIQYGHVTSNHQGFVTGLDYINPALAPVLEKIGEDLRKEIAKA